MEVNRVRVDFMLTLTLLSIEVNTRILHLLQRVWDSWKDRSTAYDYLYGFILLTHMIRNTLRICTMQDDFLMWRRLIFPRMPCILYDSYESPIPTADFTVIFKYEIWYRKTVLFTLIYLIWLFTAHETNPSSPFSGIHLACNAHTRNIRIFTVICQSAGSWHKSHCFLPRKMPQALKNVPTAVN